MRGGGCWRVREGGGGVGTGLRELLAETLLGSGRARF